MALSGLFPKGFWDSKSSPTKEIPVDHTPAPASPSSSSSSSSSSSTSPGEASASSSTLTSFGDQVEIGPGRDAQGNFKLPPVALYVSGVAFAVTVGLTVLIVPFVREAASANARAVVPTLVSHRFAARTMRPGRLRIAEIQQQSSPSPPPLAAHASNPAPTAQGTPAEVRSSKEPKTIWEEKDVPDTLAPKPLLSARQFNTREERKLYGASEADHLPEDQGGAGTASPLLGLYALGIATAIVGVSAGIGGLITAKMMGVSSVDEFARKIRSEMAESMPELAKIIEQNREEETSLMGDTTHHSTEQAWWAFVDAYFPDDQKEAKK